ncbi:anti-sigma factor [Streptomyces sp. J2-1]|uniref:anti-sigma factor n=1 Tax=Streptomyces corallincola TaxID=2851888 RepID=UPI001C37F597|nr:anti-sigma factor [Streptomyces corallincola]MBV2354897.1 anti-sigma factor [Streptomyces corallincola]
MTIIDPHTLTGAYALHALSDEERAAVDRHLADCAACAQEVEEFGATAARLALAASTPARPAMREQVLQRITTVRQTPPADTTPMRAGRALRGGAVRWALAACIAAAAALGGTTWWQYGNAQDARQQAAQAQRQADEVAGVLSAPDARTRSAKIAGGAGTLVVSAARDRAVFVTSDMPAPPRGKVYQLWFDVDGTMRSAGLMSPDRASQTVLMTGATHDASGVGITVEPAGGSRQPTSKPVALLSMPA